MRCWSAGKIWHWSWLAEVSFRLRSFHSVVLSLLCASSRCTTPTRSDRAQQNGRRTAARSRLVERESFELLELLTTSELE